MCREFLLIMLSKLVHHLEQRASAKNKARWHNFIEKVNAYGKELESLSKTQFEERVQSCRTESAAQFITQYKQSVARLIKSSSTDRYLVETFALSKEALWRCLGVRLYDVQIMGAIALHEGILPQMNTGEGKTFVIPLVAIYSAYCGMSAHVITVNEYLATRDAQALEGMYRLMGVSVGVLKEGQSLEERQEAYRQDVVYGVNHEFGFDYLRDNMVLDVKERRQQGLHFALIDEVDSILIDEARTPLIITEKETQDLHWYGIGYPLIKALSAEDFEVEEKLRLAWFTESGLRKLELALLHLGAIKESKALYLPEQQKIYGILQACLQARVLFEKDKHYIVQEDKVIIIDESTGRIMNDRRWGHGIHQAIESKEGVSVLPETKVLGQITYQNFFKLYTRLNGLTGSALSQKEEFAEIYGLHCEALPPNKPMVRKDNPDIVYRTKVEKLHAIVALTEQEHRRGRPILIGAANVEECETISRLLHDKKLPHEVLNAKNHHREAQIIAQAGAPWSITVSTNMAGRGTDILLGGDPKSLCAQFLTTTEESVPQDEKEQALALEKARELWKRQNEQVRLIGGLLVIGSARHDSMRVDTQLRGRAGRQGDPGESQFIVSLEDDLFRVYAQSGLLAMIDKMNLMPLGSALQSPLIEKGLNRAQKAVEDHQFSLRKQLLSFDQVGAQQRAVLYQWRNEVLSQSISLQNLYDMFEALFITEYVGGLIGEQTLEEQWDLKEIEMGLWHHFALPLDVAGFVASCEHGLSAQDMQQWLREKIQGHWQGVLSVYKQEGASWMYKIVLQHIDMHWQGHLEALGALKEGIHLRSISQKDPKLEYAKEAYDMFKLMLGAIAQEALSQIFHYAHREQSNRT